MYFQELLKIHKQKLQLQQQQQHQVAAAVAAAAAQNQQVAGPQPATQVQAAQANPQLTAVAAPRAGAVLTGTTVTNLQVARLVNTTFFTLEATQPSPARVCWKGQLWLLFRFRGMETQICSFPNHVHSLELTNKGVETSQIGSRKTPYVSAGRYDQNIISVSRYRTWCFFSPMHVWVTNRWLRMTYFTVYCRKTLMY